MSRIRHIPSPPRRTSLLSAALLLLVACASRTPTAPPPPVPPGSGARYVLKVGDYLDIRFYKTPELNLEVPIRSDGKISLEPVGEVQAAGLTPEELSHDLTKRYAKELTNPRVTVIVRGFGGQVFVGGEVKTPSAIAFTTGMTALQAIDGAGGFLNTAARDSVVLIRHEGDRYEGHRLMLGKVLAGDDMSADVPLQPTDVVHVPRSRIGNMNLFVEQYIRNNLPIQPGLGFGAF